MGDLASSQQAWGILSGLFEAQLQYPSGASASGNWRLKLLYGYEPFMGKLEVEVYNVGSIEFFFKTTGRNELAPQRPAGFEEVTMMLDVADNNSDQKCRFLFDEIMAPAYVTTPYQQLMHEKGSRQEAEAARLIFQRFLRSVKQMIDDMDGALPIKKKWIEFAVAFTGPEFKQLLKAVQRKQRLTPEFSLNLANNTASPGAQKAFADQ